MARNGAQRRARMRKNAQGRARMRKNAQAAKKEIATKGTKITEFAQTAKQEVAKGLGTW